MRPGLGFCHGTAPCRALITSTNCIVLQQQHQPQQEKQHRFRSLLQQYQATTTSLWFGPSFTFAKRPRHVRSLGQEEEKEEQEEVGIQIRL